MGRDREGLEIVSKPLEKIHVAQKSYRIVTPLLPDELWYIVQPLLPEHTPDPLGGRSSVSADRRCLVPCSY